MKRVYFLVLLANVILSDALPTQTRNTTEQIDTNLQTPRRIEADGYPVETHHVVTTDGYILEMHRIPHGRIGENSTEARQPVFLMHGLTSASVAYVAIGPELSVAYNLADAGFDVWMGNARGNRDSRRHTTLNPDDNEEKFTFFDFTWDEIGYYDVPAMIDYTLDHTGFDKLHYIGHSQGGTVFFVLNTLRPEYNDKIKTAHLLAPAGYKRHFPNEQLVVLANNVNLIYGLALTWGLVELFPPGFNISDLPEIPGLFPRGPMNCMRSTDMAGLCNLAGVRQHYLRRAYRDDETEEDWLSMFGGAAVKQYAHYGQNVASGIFRRWDYGTAGNLAAYGTEEPTEYDLQRITIKTTVHYTVSDDLVGVQDVLDMVDAMPNAVARRVARDTFGHTDFAIATDAKELVTDFIIDSLLQADSEEDNENAEIDSPGTEGGGASGEEGDPVPEPQPSSSNIVSIGTLLKFYLTLTLLTFFV